jgi:protein-S-isoprenylcysteine O-methyltransferase Ste14
MQDRASVAILPPVIPLIALSIGGIAHFIFRAPIADRLIVTPFGAILMSLSVGLVSLASRELAQARTAFDVRKSTTRLVQGGVYSLSRNPIYLSMLLLCWAIGLLSNSLSILLAALPAGSALCLAVIRPEERYLERKFGPAYRDYTRRVRRWL